MQITDSIQSLSTSLQQLSKERERIKVEEHLSKRQRAEEAAMAANRLSARLVDYDIMV